MKNVNTKQISSFKTVNGKEACTTHRDFELDGKSFISFKTVNGKEACTTSQTAGIMASR